MWRCSVPYLRVERWAKAFRKGKDAVQDNLRTGRAQVENNTVEFLASLLEADRQWTATEIGVSHKTVLHILYDILGYR